MKDLINQLKNTQEEAIDVLEQLRNGDRTYSELGEYYYDDLGDTIISALENAIEYIENYVKK